MSANVTLTHSSRVPYEQLLRPHMSAYVCKCYSGPDSPRVPYPRLFLEAPYVALFSGPLSTTLLRRPHMSAYVCKCYCDLDCSRVPYEQLFLEGPVCRLMSANVTLAQTLLGSLIHDSS
ncbi:hypothetical protein J6590_026138 [Homalodisca vitripennis]|nr:hypothetical protein J6590_026138 [Homalodisca vitripennis]